MKKKLSLFASALCLLLNCNFYANAQNETDYTTPSWTLYQRSVTSGTPNASVLVSKDFPYNVNVTVNGDPTKQFGATWFTNAGVTGSKLQLKEGVTTDFTGAREISATSVAVNDLMYVSSGNNNNDLVEKTGFAKGDKRSYVSNKVLIDNLKAGTTYSYRVGGLNDKWSETGTFTTAKANKDEFEFIYIADTQSNDDSMFEVSRKTVARAQQDVPNAKFLLIAGDLVETSGNSNSEWEWEQWFETMKTGWQKLPIVPIQGNHDTSGNSNMFYHFNTDKSFNAAQTDAAAKTAMDGTVYSFVYGDALFMCVNWEDYSKGEPYFSALESWMRTQVNANKDVKWRIVAYHKAMFTGSGSHQSDNDAKIVRERFAKIFQELGINLAIQGHDHIYEVVGVIATDNTTFTHLPKNVKGQTFVPDSVGSRSDMTGIHGGKFNVNGGVLYFLNNSAGKKKYEPRTKVQMDGVAESLGVPGYYEMFNRFGQTGEPTFSKVTVSSSSIKISTYTVNDQGEATLFDAFEVVNRSEADYTTPSWTLYQRALSEGKSDDEANSLLVSKDFPYNVNVVVNGDPTKQFGATWFTNAGVTDGVLQLVQGKVTDASAFASARSISATIELTGEMNYNIVQNKLDGIDPLQKKSYASHKALIDNLQPNTTYSYRVGKDGAWSQIGIFTTAKANKDAFEFIYVTDPQSQNDDMFTVSKTTFEAAQKKIPEAKFMLCAGDFIESGEESYYGYSSEWEWEQWFERFKPTCFNLPIVPIQGNHDTSKENGMYYHFNTNKGFNAAQATDATRTKMEGTVYSFIYGDALFMVVNYEDIGVVVYDENNRPSLSNANPEYLNALEAWMRAQVADHKDVKWKIVSYHKTMFTGSGSHQDDVDGKYVRERMAPVFQDLGIDLVLQGHDHIYEVIGVLTAGKNGSDNVYTHLPDAVQEQETVTPTPADADNKVLSTDVTGKRGGVYDVSEGVLYFLNNSAGEKKYYPRSDAQMTGSISNHGVDNYFTLFNKFGQTGNPTFSRVNVATDTITIETYEVNKNTAEIALFDAFKVVKNSNTGIKKVVSNSGKLNIYPSPASNSITVETQEKIENIRVFSLTGQEVVSQKNGNTVNLSTVGNGIYVLSVKTADNIYTEQFIVKK